MCTAISYKTKQFYFGRTLDYEFSYGEEIVITPRRFGMDFRHVHPQKEQYAMIGMAHVESGVPLYYEAVNEKGLGMAGLNFAGNAVYGSCVSGMENIASFELIPYLLGRCSSVAEAKQTLRTIQLVDTAFSPQLPPSPLHWLIADGECAITVESTRDGLHIYDNPVGVLTNNPPFPMQMLSLSNYRHLSPRQPENHFSPNLSLPLYSRGMGGLGLPGDLSSQSRFIRAAFVKSCSPVSGGEKESVSQFFHILGTVAQPKGCCEVEDGKFEYTIYTSCCNASTGVYYYTSYNNPQITAVNMHKENLDGASLIRFPLLHCGTVKMQNQGSSD